MGESFRWYMNYKISSIKWYNSIVSPSKKLGYFATGSWDQENVICLNSLELPSEDEPVSDPVEHASIRHIGDVTDLKWLYYTPVPHLVSSSSNGHVNLYRVPLSDSELPDAKIDVTQEKSWKIHNGPCTAIAVHQDYQHIASVGEDGKIAIFNIADTLPSRTIENAESFAITGTQFVTSNLLATVTSNGSIKFWDTRVQASNSSVVAIQDTIEHSNLRAISVHPTQPDYLAVGSSDGTLSVWDSRSHKAPISRFQPEAASTTKVMFHPTTPSFIFSSYMNGNVLLWDFNASRDVAMGTFQVDQDNSRLYGVVNEPFSVNDLDVNVELKAMICGSDEGAIVVKTGIE